MTLSRPYGPNKSFMRFIFSPDSWTATESWRSNISRTNQLYRTDEHLLSLCWPLESCAFRHHQRFLELCVAILLESKAVGPGYNTRFGICIDKWNKPWYARQSVLCHFWVQLWRQMRCRLALRPMSKSAQSHRMTDLMTHSPPSSSWPSTDSIILILMRNERKYWTRPPGVIACSTLYYYQL